MGDASGRGTESAEEALEPFKVPLRPLDEEFEATEEPTARSK